MTTSPSADRSRTERARADARKAGGVHYTPPELAAFVATNALATARVEGCLRVLDPACGDGALLAAIAELAPESCEVELVGCDKDVTALTAADRRLTSLGLPHTTWRFESCDFLVEAARLRDGAGSLFDGASDVLSLLAPFDIVIANPPYVRTQTLGAAESRRLATAFELQGRVDLYHAFAVAMTASLRQGGVLALLCSNRFMTTKGGGSLRHHLQARMSVEGVYDLGDTKLFEAAVLPAVVIATRRAASGGAAPMASVYECPPVATAITANSVLSALEDGYEGHLKVRDAYFQIRRGALRLEPGSGPWVLASEADGWVEQVDQHAAMRFGDLGKIRVGIKTTADKVFIRDDWHDLEVTPPEAELLHPLLTHHSACRWFPDEPRYRVLYPYDMEQVKRVPLDLAHWPWAAAYLEQHRERLEGRRYVIEAGREWWEIWVPQRPSEWVQPKLVFPDISEQPRFSLDRTGSLVNGDCYWLALTSEVNKSHGLLAMAVANSSLGTRYYDQVCGNKLYSGRRRYITQYVERFPIPDPEVPEARKITSIAEELGSGGLVPSDIARAEEEIDSLVWQSFGFEEIPG